ncbi:MAG: DUF302 domain-containing protein [Candidatus Promineifilaceae bacterium]|nr:DUF302 domain-containing protein [Candidatus Promineifilaceae bacterium]
MTDLGIKVYMNMPYDAVLEQVTEALKEEGFGVLTEIDVKSTLKEKLNVSFRRYKILGACNPGLAYRALNTNPDVGMLLPCNVTVAQEEDGRILVSLIDPTALLNDPALDEVAQEAGERLERVALSLAG